MEGGELLPLNIWATAAVVFVPGNQRGWRKERGSILFLTHQLLGYDVNNTKEENRY